MNISAPFIYRPVMTTFVMLSILFGGWMAFRELPVSDLPAIEYPQIQVTTEYRGANPDVVLHQVTTPLEKELGHVNGVQSIFSTSQAGFSFIHLQFDLNKRMDEAVQDVQAAIERAKQFLPDELERPPRYEMQSGRQDCIMYLLLTSDIMGVGNLRNYADAYIIPRLNRIDGVANVMAWGSEKSLWLKVNPELLAARGIGLNQVVDTIRNHTEKQALGSINSGNKTFSIELLGSPQQAKEFENLKIADSPLYIRDIGEVSANSSNDQVFHVVSHGKTSSALIVGIQKIHDGNTVKISQNVHDVLGDLENELPASCKIDIWLDKAVWIQQSIHEVEWSLFIAFALVVIVIYFSLGRFREALIPSSALPLSIIGTFVFMYLFHYTLDLLSLLALTLSVGFVVDDAIVVLENIVRHKEKGLDARAASLLGSKQICFTIVSMTLSLVCVFLPLLFMPGINGRLFREFSVTLAVAILVSGFISLTLIPMLSSRFLTSQHEPSKLQRLVTKGNASCLAIYSKCLNFCFTYPKTILSFALVMMAVTIPLFNKLPIQMIPPEDRGYLFSMVTLPSGIPPTVTKEYLKKLETTIATHSAVDEFFDVSFEDNLFFCIRLVPNAARPKLSQVVAEVQQLIDNQPGVQGFTDGYQLIALSGGMGQGGQYEYSLRGFEYSDVMQASEQLTRALTAFGPVSFVQNSNAAQAPKLSLQVNEELAHRYGVEKQQVAQLLQQAFGKNALGTIREGAIQENIYMELLPEFRAKNGGLDTLFITQDSGAMIPLKAVASWQETQDSQHLDHSDLLPSVTINFALKPEIAPNEGLEKVEQLTKKMLPAGVTGELSGHAKNVSRMLKDTLALLFLAACVMYIVLGILYESFIHPLTILSSLPFAGLGGILTLFLFNEPLSIFSAVGFLLLIGIVKKNGIMMVDFAQEAEKSGLDPKAAIKEGCLARFRPIMMTTVAAIMGAIPIAIGFGEGESCLRGLGLVIAGGLIFSQLLTLFVTPILYLTFSKWQKHA